MKMKLAIGVAAVLLALPAALHAADDAVQKSEFIFETAPFPSCHASTIVETRSGLAAAWFGGSAEGKADVGIWMSRQEGGKWSAPVEAAAGAGADGKREPCWNPVLFQPKAGPLMLFYKVGPSPQSWWGMLKTSADDGKTWSPPERLPDGILGPIKNKPVQLADGAILCGSSDEGLKTPPAWRIHFERSTDSGRTWTRIAAASSADAPPAIQPSILVHADGRLQAIGRTRAGKVFSTLSSDSGLAWTPLALLDLPNPNSGMDAVTLRDSRHLLVYNHTAKGRTPLNVALSRDGQAWSPALVLETEPGEYSYPAVIQTRDGLVHVTYTWKRQRIKHVVIDPARL